jgi:cAMP-specific phosphodiesterase 4
LGIFVLEIIFHTYSYGRLYLRDVWNIIDIVVILISIAFVLLDLLIKSNNSLRGFLKIRGIFRLLRVFILIRKLNMVRLRREVRRRFNSYMGYDIRSPLEKVLEIMNDIRECVDSS